MYAGYDICTGGIFVVVIMGITAYHTPHKMVIEIPTLLVILYVTSPVCSTYNEYLLL